MKRTNNLKKSITWEWIHITTKNGVSYQRRQRKKVLENDATKIQNKTERLLEWKNKDSLAGLKDQLAVSLKYNRNYYDTSGNPIYVPAQYQDIVEEIHHSKNNDSTFTNFLTGNKTDLEKQKKKRLIGLIKLKDKLFQQEFEKKKAFFEQTQNNPVTIKRNIKSFLDTIHANRSSLADMIYALRYARQRIDSSIDPTIEFTFKGQKEEKTLDQLLERLEKAKLQAAKPGENTGIQKLEMMNIDDYDLEDFVRQEYMPTKTDHSDLVARTNKKYDSLKRD